jgi:glycine hydroxymethyltransferase
LALPELAQSLSLNVKYIPFTDNKFDAEWDKLNKEIKNTKPSLVYFNPKDTLFSYSPEKLEENNDTIFIFDISSCASFILSGQMENPLKYGFDALAGSFDYNFPGPSKSIFAASNEALTSKLSENCKKKTGTIYTDNLLAFAISLIEFNEYGESFARQIIKNANVLGETLSKAGLDIVSKNNIYSDTHQTWLKTGDQKTASDTYKKLEHAGINCSLSELGFSLGWGIKFGVQNLTFLGCKENEIKELGDFIIKVIKDNKSGKEFNRKIFSTISKLEPEWTSPDFMMALLKHYIFEDL